MFKDINQVHDNAQCVYKNIMAILYSLDDVNTVEGAEIFDPELYNFNPIKGNHVVKPSYGLLITDIKANHDLLITGDTKASKIIKQIIIDAYNDERKITVFHDYQGNCNPLESVHCCKKDFELYYEDLVAPSWIKWYLYHNDEFNEECKEKEFKIS